MKIWLPLILATFIFSACSNKQQNDQLRQINARQAAIIKEQNAEISMLREKFLSKQKAKALKAKKRAARAKQLRAAKQNGLIPQAPKKQIKLKKVEDKNYSSNYMYPGSKKITTPKPVIQHTPITTATTSTSESMSTTSQTPTGMTKSECISMIGADKFDKYTAMFGSENASLKRCKMLKAMKQ